jgi:hypothetical protein
MTTSLAETLYPECRYKSNGTPRTYFDSPDDYTPIIQSFGHIIVRTDEDGYQGDTFVLLGKDDRYGFLVFGWGSCSGCDALQACDSYDDIDALITQLENTIHWFDTFEAAQTYINDDPARRGSYYYHADTWTEFKAAVNALAAPTS